MAVEACRWPSLQARVARLVRVGTLAILIDLSSGPATALGAEITPPLQLVALRTEYQENPLGLDARQPRLSWQLTAAGRGVRQSAYEIRVAQTKAAVVVGRDLVWSSGRVASDESTQRAYQGPALRSRQRYHWQVRVWDGGGIMSDWSAPASWEMGLLEPADWKANWIEPGLPEDITTSGAVPLLRHAFKLGRNVKRARVYVTSHGLYALYLNGQRVGDQIFTPGWTSYKRRLQYQDYDVTSLLRTGDNVVGALLGNGWYRGYLGWEGRRNVFGDQLALLSQIEITYQDDSREMIGSDASWKAATGPLLMSEVYHGETYDARLEQAGWTEPGFDDRSWAGVKVADHPKDHLVAPAGPPVRRISEIAPVKIFQTPGGDTVADLGQNMVGWIRLRVQGAAGTTVTLRYAEVLDQRGNF